MSPSKSKAKDKKAGGKEPLKSSTKPTTANTAASGYNPLLGTFHTLETAPVSSVPPAHVNNTRFRDIEDTDDPSGNSLGTGVEYDCASNNGSWSGESEDPKDKPSHGPVRPETVPGVDIDKREKLRQKNEKKHQRQKERRAHELHERCCGYLMSRKLEALAQQLVAMGFTLERATMALIMNEGKVEESVAWLFEGGEEDGGNHQREHNIDNGGNLKVDISQELAQIADMEIKFKCSKQEVERAIVACEGDLEQAAENLMKAQRQESHGVPPKAAETGDPASVGGSGGGKPSVGGNGISQMSSTSKVQAKRSSSSGAMPIPQKADEKDTNYYPNTGFIGGRSITEPMGKNIQLLKKGQPNSDWVKQQQTVATPSVEKRWSSVGGLSPSVAYSLASPLQAAPPQPPPPPSKTETAYASLGNEFKNLQLGSAREPVIMMQRPQSKHIPTTSMSQSSSPGGSHFVDWNSNGVVDPVMGMNPNRFSHSRSFNNTPSYESGMGNVNNQMYDQFHYQQRQQPPLPPHQQQQRQQHYVSSSGLFDHHSSQPVGSNHMNNSSNGMWNRMVGGSTTHTLGAATSLGLFSGLGSGSNSPNPSGPSHVDWNGDWASKLDYTNVDWSLDRAPSPAGSSIRPNGLWMGWGGGYSSPNGGRTAVRPTVANGNSGVSIGGGGGVGLHHPDGVGGVGGGSETSGGGGGGGSLEWSSPFEEKDLFGLSRKFVSSPTL